MKYGLLYYKDTDNIGDDFQVYAASLFLPRVDYLIDREKIELFVPDKKERVATIMNGWYAHDKFNFNFSPYILPKLIAMYIKKYPYVDGYIIGSDYLTDDMKNIFKKYGPVGARDDSTKELLAEKGIDAYVSYCLTLTIPKRKGVKNNEKIFAVNLSDEEIKKIRKSTDREVVAVNQDIEAGSLSDLSWEQRRKNATDLLDLYQGAHMVVTTKLHCALPCTALNTPVFLLLEDRNYREDNKRFSTFLPLVNYCKREDFMKLKIDFNNPSKNPDKYLKIREKLIKDCTDFINDAPNQVETESLPEINEYLFYINKMRSEKKIITNFLDKLAITYVEECKKSSVLYDENQEMKYEINTISKTKTFKFIEFLKGIKNKIFRKK